MVSGLTQTPPVNETTVGDISLLHGVTATNTKDSLMIRWGINHDYAATIHSFKIRYQAHQSNVVQWSPDIPASNFDYEITQLHENTYYDVCIKVVTNITHFSPSQCIKATTSTDSLSVALGSTFGAFLALGVIVGFVFLAKWNHNRKLAKQLHHQNVELADSYESVDQRDDLELSEVSLAVNEDTLPLDVSSSRSSSQYSAPQHRSSTANGTSHRHGSGRSKHSQSLRRPGEGPIRRSERGTSSLRRLDSRDSQGIPEEGTPTTSPAPLAPLSPLSTTSPTTDGIESNGEVPENPFAYPDGRPPDVRPKQSSSTGSSQASYSLSAVSPHSGLRPNLSCPNWLAQS